MVAKKMDKEQLVAKAAELFRINGYHNTSISDIASACNLSKASIYHHIPSKKELAIASIQQLHQHFDQNLLAIAYDDSQKPRDRLERLMLNTEEFFIDRRGGCMMGNLVLEVLETIPDFVELFQAYFTSWIDAIVHILKYKFESERAREIAEDVVSQLQGAIMFGRLYGNNEPLKRVRISLLTLFTESAANRIKDRRADEDTVEA